MSLSRRFLFGLAIASLGLHSAEAVLVIDSQSIVAPPGGAVHQVVDFDWPLEHGLSGPSSVDLLQGLLPSFVDGSLEIEQSGGAPVLTDGSDSTVFLEDTPLGDDVDHAGYATAGSNGAAGSEIVYTLPLIYDIQNIVVFGGWNDEGRDSQNYEVFYSTDNGDNYNFLGSVNNNPGIDENPNVTSPIGWRSEFSEDAEDYIAEGVTDLKFVFDTFTHENGYTGYSEIDVFGDPLNVLGDANGDQAVDIEDFYIISNNFLTVPSEPGADGDVMKDDFVDKNDFRLWKDLATPEALAQFYGTAAPEPSSLLVAFAFGACGLTMRRRN